ncbi:hypothetical protein F4804DRAFT_321451 [Jackrogersella minutella]|nr:hypothetical protein F4804DRAFT_321451 [Jackrogersella minutella]
MADFQNFDLLPSLLSLDNSLEVFDNAVEEHEEEAHDGLPITATTRNLVNKDPKRPIIRAASTRSSSEDHVVADLADYIKDACQDTGYCKQLPIFSQGAGHFTPQLEQNRMNRILLYTGCFNPPHHGHQALLNHAFSCSQDLNVIAAIVLPVDDWVVQRKPIGDIWFTKERRTQLWTGDELHDWFWVYKREMCTWHGLRQSLERKVKADGFHLEFINLCGPDHVGVDYVTSYCKNVIVSDVGRAADFIRADGTLAHIKGCRSWEPVSYDTIEMKREAADTARWLLSSLSFTMLGEEHYRGLIEEIYSEYASRMKGVQLCRRRNDPNRWVRFIPAPSGAATISSTEIRRIIKEGPRRQVLEKLKGKALHPEMLAGLIRKRDWQRRNKQV